MQNSPQNTQYDNNWAVNDWSVWATKQNSAPDASSASDEYKVVPVNPQNVNQHELGFWLSRLHYRSEKFGR